MNVVFGLVEICDMVKTYRTCKNKKDLVCCKFLSEAFLFFADSLVECAQLLLASVFDFCLLFLFQYKFSLAPEKHIVIILKSQANVFCSIY